MAPTPEELQAARDRAMAALAPTGRDLERQLIALHEQSATSQRIARESQARARQAILDRLAGGTYEVDKKGNVKASEVTTRELIGLMAAESDAVKVEAMAQRSYTVHRIATSAGGPGQGTFEEFIVKLEQEETDEQLALETGAREALPAHLDLEEWDPDSPQDGPPPSALEAG